MLDDEVMPSCPQCGNNRNVKVTPPETNSGYTHICEKHHIDARYPDGYHYFTPKPRDNRTHSGHQPDAR